MFARPLSCCLYIAAKVSEPHGGVIGQQMLVRGDEKMDVSVQVCVCEEKVRCKERKKGGQVKDERENQDPDQRTESSKR